jgi:hypothetical protein
MDEMDTSQQKLSIRERMLLTLLIALISFIASVYFSHLTGVGAGDLRYSLLLARDWLAGKDPYLPYKLNIDPFAVPYPFIGVLFSMPLVWLPDRIAAAIFSACGAALLAWLILKHGENWRLLLFASWPFYNSLIFTQWAPYIVSMFFTPSLLFFIFVKPQSALPFALTQKPNLIGLILAGCLLLISLVLYPSWPFDWFKTIHNYIGYPPLFVLPLGPLILLSLIRYRDKRSWLLVLLAAMPQRMVYDQLGVLLVTANRKQMIFLVLCSWITLPAVWYFDGWGNLPYGWKNWVLIGSYLPALIVLLLPIAEGILTSIVKFNTKEM